MDDRHQLELESERARQHRDLHQQRRAHRGDHRLDHHQHHPVRRRRAGFYVHQHRDLSIEGAGVVNNSAFAPTLANNFFVFFANGSSAGNLALTNNGFITFADTSSAGSATIINSGGGTLISFADSSTAFNATVTTNGGALTQFTGNATAGNAKLVTAAGGIVDFSGSSGPTGNNQISAGSIEGAGDYFLGANQLTVGGNNLSSTVSGTINDGGNFGGSGASLVKIGAGTLTLSGVNTYSGGTTVSGGTLQLGDGGTTGSIVGDVTVGAGAIFAINRSDTFTLANGVSGAGGFAQNGSGTTILTQAYGYTGGTTVNAGKLQLGDIGTPGSIVGNVLVNTGAFLEIRNSDFSGVTTVTNNGTIDFRSTSTAASATFINNGNLDFRNDSSAVNATITNNLDVGFHGNATAANAVIVNNGLIDFAGRSTGGNAQVTNNTGATIDFSASAGPADDRKLSIGSIAGPGSVYLGANQLTLGNALNSTISGVISDCGPTGAECLAVNAVVPSTGGSLVKAGSGTLTLTGANSYTGATAVNAGTLIVNGSIASSSLTTVNAGATLGGSGTLGSTTINGGTLSPGNSIGTITINGNLAFVGAGNYLVEVSPASADRTNVTGKAILSGTVNVTFAPGVYTKPNYVILSAAGGLTGTFGALTTTNQPSFVSANLSYTATDALLNLTLSLAKIAGVTPSQQAAAAALDSAFNAGTLPAGLQPLLNLTAAQLAPAFNALSGEVHASTLSVLADESLYLRSAVLGRLRQASFGSEMGAMAALKLGGPQVFAEARAPEAIDSAFAYAKSPIVTKAPMKAPSATSDVVFWAQGFGAWGRFNGDGNAATVRRDLGGFITGVDTRVGGNGRAGLAAGYTGSKNALDGRGASNVETGHIAAYGGWSFGAFNLRGGAAYAFHAIDTDRTVAFPGFFDRATARQDGSTGQIFGELGYGFAFGNVAVEPFAGGAFVRMHTDGAAERALAAGLNIAANTFEVGYSTFGLRAASMIPVGHDLMLVPRGTLAWQHAFGNVTPDAALAFQFAPAAGFIVSGVPIARDALLAEAGLDLAVGRHATLGVAYTGQIASNVADHAAKGKFSWRF